MGTYNPSETNLPKWAQQELAQLRAENLNLHRNATGQPVAHVVRLERDWFVLPGPQLGEPAIRLWMLTEEGPKQIGVLQSGQSLMFQQEPGE